MAGWIVPHEKDIIDVDSALIEIFKKELESMPEDAKVKPTTNFRNLPVTSESYQHIRSKMRVRVCPVLILL